jgi:hypothetical protein
MTLNTLFTVTAVVAGAFGLGFIFAPATMQQPFGIDAVRAADSAHLGRFLGAYMLSFAIVFWSMRRTPVSETRTIFSKAISLTFVVGVLVALTEQVSGAIGPLGWSIVAIYGFFTAAYGYFGFAKGAAV